MTTASVKKPVNLPHPLVAEFKGLRRALNVPAKTVAYDAEVNVSTIFSWEERHLPRIDKFDAALNCLGYRLAIVPISKRGVQR